MPDLCQFTARDGHTVWINIARIDAVVKDGAHAQIWVGGQVVEVRETADEIGRSLATGPQTGG
jgi:hypothetical protein